MDRELINPVETQNALYEVVFGIHQLPNRESIEGIDALVVETGRVDRLTDWTSRLAKHVQMGNLIRKAHGAGVPVCGGDVVPPDSWMTYRLQVAPGEYRDEMDLLRHDPDLYGELVEGLDASLQVYGGFIFDWMDLVLNGGSIEYSPEIVEAQDTLGNPSVQWRNAICAEKCEEKLAPYLAEELGHKPHIMILYGGGHMGIVDDLQDPERREVLLRDMYSVGVEELDPDDLHSITIATPVAGESPKSREGWDMDEIYLDPRFMIE